MVLLLGPIPMELTKLVGLKVLNLRSEGLLEGFIIGRFGYFLKTFLGEFPLVEGSFQNLIQIHLPSDQNGNFLISS